MKDTTQRLFAIQEAVDSDESPFHRRVSAKTLYNFVKAGKLPGVVRIGRRVYLTAEGMREFIATGGAK